ncbi:hypothetical protein [Polluticaenibacter yanchengensis]|uniref:Uncharacterized protein n=1 Tax=Polluticaenibacter yanchengensis TaxID=3014562 RepID=A0ABT4UL28_9BACT|nr:hypothetical protein [Chitinophagaceae bacterium LY-5]
MTNTDGLLVRKYTQENGLTQNTIRGIRFDANNFIWLATDIGLSNFNGTSFRTYGLDQIKGLINPRFILMSKDKEGSVYALNEDGHTVKLVQDSHNGMYYPTYVGNHYLHSFNGNIINLQHLNINKDIRVLLEKYILKNPEATFFNLLDDSTGYFNINNQLYFFSGHQFQTLTFNNNNDRSYDFIIGNNYFMYENGHYNLVQKGVITRRNLLFNAHKKELSRSAHDNRSYILRAKSDTINYYIDDKLTIYKIRHEDSLIALEKLNFALPIDHVRDILYDAELKFFFIGTSLSGFYTIDRSLFQVPQDDIIKYNSLNFQYYNPKRKRLYAGDFFIDLTSYHVHKTSEKLRRSRYFRVDDNDFCYYSKILHSDGWT